MFFDKVSIALRGYTEVVIAALVLLAPFAVSSKCASKSCAHGVKGDFSYYTIAAFHYPGICAVRSYSSWRSFSRDRVCDYRFYARYRRMPLVLHGLWPESRTGQLMYCSVSDCCGCHVADSELLKSVPGLSRYVFEDIKGATPFFVDFIHRHQWYKHGTCDVFDPDAFFENSILALHELSRLFSKLPNLEGARVSYNEVLEMIQHQRSRNRRLASLFNLDNISLRCVKSRRRGLPVLVEVWAKIPKNFSKFSFSSLPRIPYTNGMLYPRECPRLFYISSM
ncbi:MULTISPECIES: hypothetical protein [Candidatus Ichthyocystis]|uniref:Putative Ribonuclease n=1 Tax=Candidatus Ichthyocystis hellenicum TaxID=1561003 RepID=A0A0S4M2Z6_9BURK|nr:MULTISPECIES: hypothetical protein [Ichthyocystis]CUT18062.1 putative Ribonuclease [Candidatus Ichthyocystis hellenicum]